MYHFHQMPKAVSFPKIERKKSKLHGYGVFALESINKNKRIIDYAGELITNKQSEAREDRYLAKGCIWVFRVNRNWSRDAAVGGNIARFINHSCKPNCYIDVDAKTKTIWVRAAKHDSQGPGADLRLQHRGRQGDSLPVPARLHDEAMKWIIAAAIAMCRVRAGHRCRSHGPGARRVLHPRVWTIRAIVARRAPRFSIRRSIPDRSSRRSRWWPRSSAASSRRIRRRSAVASPGRTVRRSPVRIPI